MRADNSRHLATAAQQRSECTRQRALAALRRMHTRGDRISVEALAHEAAVSRSWIYGQPDIRLEIERARAHDADNRRPRSVPAGQRASDDSLRRRLEVATARAQRLEVENQQLRHALAAALGEQRAANILSHNGRRNGAKLYGPC